MSEPIREKLADRAIMPIFYRGDGDFREGRLVGKFQGFFLAIFLLFFTFCILVVSGYNIKIEKPEPQMATFKSLPPIPDSYLYIVPPDSGKPKIVLPDSNYEYKF